MQGQSSRWTCSNVWSQEREFAHVIQFRLSEIACTEQLFCDNGARSDVVTSYNLERGLNCSVWLSTCNGLLQTKAYV